MRIVIAGGSGFIGRRLIAALLDAKHHVILLSRNPEKTLKTFPAVKSEFWDAKSSGLLVDILNEADALINLTGESIAAKRWSSEQKKKILSSRIESTRAIVNAAEKTQHHPSVLLNASAVGYYGNVPEDEAAETYPKGIGFLSDVCDQWEREALKIQKLGVRCVLLRTGIVLDKEGGTLQKLLLPFKAFIGGPLGSGRQWFPWIHIKDEIGIILHAMENEKIEGPVNLSALESLRMSEFCKTLGSVLNRPSWLKVPEFALRLIFGEMSEILLQGQRVVPRKIIDAGYEFRYPDLKSALTDLLH
ncbi:MAG: TIGR01777 family oxidoreductase [Bacteroidetes bacterium]|nr:TIGR01777 family oxidoreductase [Bacteroidota bacterium]